jgi:hypothetical protein
MNKTTIKKAAPYVLAIVLFIGVTLVYFSPVFSGKVLMQSDVMNYNASAKEALDHFNKTGEQALWTGSMFGGMPAFQISVHFKGTVMPAINQVFKLWLPSPADLFIMLLIGFFILMLALRSDPWLATIGALAFAFSTFFLIFLAVGHTTKIMAIAYLPATLAGMILIYRGKYMLGTALLTLFMALEINAGHVQITYYLFMFIGIFIAGKLVYSIIQKQTFHFLKATGLVLTSTILAIGPNIGSLWTSYDYMKETIRGGVFLSHDTIYSTPGLNKKYITEWSYGLGETFTLMIPDAKGGKTEAIATNKDLLAKADKMHSQAIGQRSQYWGNLPLTSGPVYAGAFVVFLFILGLFIVKGELKWIILAATVLFVMLSWGHNFKWLTDFFIDHVPFYNRFRAVTNTLIMVNLIMPLLGMLAVKEIIENPGMIRKKNWLFIIPLILTAGIALLFILAPKLFFNFLSNAELKQFAEARSSSTPNNVALIAGIQENLEAIRISVFRLSALRSIVFILIGAGVLFIYTRFNKLNKYLVYAAIGLIILADLWMVDRRYLNNNNFTTPAKVNVPFVAGTADQSILQDNDPSYRVLDLTSSNFSIDARPSHFHKSIGGYHAAKLRRYQDLIEHRIRKEIGDIRVLMSAPRSDSVFFEGLRSLTALNMLNARYYIYDQNKPALRNNLALGNAWFVPEIKFVESPDHEIEALDTCNLRTTAIVHSEFRDILKGIADTVSPGSRISLTEYSPNRLKYEAKGITAPQFAVFSEIYYPRGWKAYLDGVETPVIRANYALRGLVVPPGDHLIEFRFEPAPFYSGAKISLAGSILLIIVVIGGIAYEFRSIFTGRKTVQSKAKKTNSKTKR